MGVGGVVCHGSRLCIMLQTLGTSTDGVLFNQIWQGLAISMIVSCLWRLTKGMQVQLHVGMANRRQC